MVQKTKQVKKRRPKPSGAANQETARVLQNALWLLLTVCVQTNDKIVRWEEEWLDTANPSDFIGSHNSVDLHVRQELLGRGERTLQVWCCQLSLLFDSVKLN